MFAITPQAISRTRRYDDLKMEHGQMEWNEKGFAINLESPFNKNKNFSKVQ